MTTPTGSRATPVAAATLSALLLLSACSSEPATTPGSKMGEGSEATYSDANLAAFAEYTGAALGAADEASGTVTIGWVNNDTGFNAVPELSDMFSLAIDLVNDELGGIDGNAIVIDACDLGSAEAGVSCAQRFVNSDEHLLVVAGNISSGADTFYATMKGSGVPVVGVLPLGAVDGAADNAFHVGPGSFNTVPSVLALALEEFEVKTVALVGIEGDPISGLIGGQLGGALQAAGVTVNRADIAIGSPDLTAPLVAAGATSADLLVPLVIQPNHCIAVAEALDTLQAELPVLGLSICRGDMVKEALGDYPMWSFLFNYENTQVETGDDAVDAQIDAYNAWYASTGAAVDAVIAMQGALTAQRHLLAAGGTDATRESIIAAAQDWTGPIFLGGEVAYGAVTAPFPLPALPNNKSKAYTYEGDGEYTELLDGRWF